MSKVCTNCNKQLPDDAVFCDSCGERLNVESCPINQAGAQANANVNCCNNASEGFGNANNGYNNVNNGGINNSNNFNNVNNGGFNNFQAGSFNGYAPSPKKNKAGIVVGVVAAVIVAVVVLIVVLVNGDSKSNGVAKSPEAALQLYIETVYNGKYDNFENIAPKEYFESKGITPKELKEQVRMVTSIVKVSNWEIIDESKSTSDERDYVIDELEDRYSIPEEKIGDMFFLVVECDVNIKGYGTRGDYEINCGAVEIAGNWYIIGDGGFAPEIIGL